MTAESKARSKKAAQKPITIGAALRQRMSDPDPSSSEGETARAAQVDRLEPTLQPQVTVPASEVASDPLEAFNTRLPRSLLRRMKVHSAVHDLKIQDLVHQAMLSYFADQKEE